MTSVSTRDHGAIAIVLLLAIVGAWGRFSGLDAKGLWSDELTAAGMVLRHSLLPQAEAEWFRRADGHHLVDSDTFWTAKAAETTPPLSELAGKISTTLFGPTEASLRLPSAVASVLLMFWFLRKALTSSSRTESGVFLWVVALSAVSGPYLQYAQEARAYSLGLLLCGVLLTGWYERSATSFTSGLPGWGEIVVFIAAWHTHYLLIVLTSTLLATYLLVGVLRRDWPGLGRLCFIPVAFAPWLALHWDTTVAASQGGYSSSALLGRVESVERGLSLTTQLLSPQLVLAVLVVIWIVAWSAVSNRSQPVSVGEFRAPFLALTTTIAVYLLLAPQIVRGGGVWNSRHFLFVLPAVHLAIGLVLIRLSRHPLFLTAFCLTTIASQAGSFREYRNTPKEGYREGAAWLEPLLKPGSIVVTSWEPNRYYYGFYLNKWKQAVHQISVSGSNEGPGLCERLKHVESFGVIAHATHYPVMVENVVSCDGTFEVLDTATYPNIIAQRWSKTAKPAPAGR